MGLRPHNMADMRAFLNLSAFLTELLPLLGPQLFSRWNRMVQATEKFIKTAALKENLILQV